MITSQFIFIRHGQSQANAANIIADSTSSLTDYGVEQAHRAGNEAKGFGIKTVVCSPYPRARLTAEIIADELGIGAKNVKIIDGLKERGLGDCEGKIKTQPDGWYSQSDGPTLEPRQELLDRVNVALNEIKMLSESGRVLAVGHAVSGLFLLDAAKGAKTVVELGGDVQIANAAFVNVDIL